MAKGISQKCRLLLEGKEVPFIGATIACNIGEPLTAVIELVPLQVIKFIKPKTQVHIFVQDTFNFGDSNFYLAFEGEVVGRAMMKRDGARAFQITAVDYSGYWDEAKGYYYNPNFLVGKIDDVETGGVSPNVEVKAEGATKITTSSTINSAMIDIIVKAIKGTSTDLIDGVVNVVKALNQINLFYKAAFNRLRITDRIRVSSSGNIKSFLRDLKMDEFLLTFTGKQGGMVSLREMLLNVMGLIFHDFVSVPFPSLLSSPKTTDPLAGHTIGNFLFVPDGYSLPPPKCNVVFPNYIQSFEFRDDFRATPTRFAFRASFPGFFQEFSGVKTYPMQFYPTSFKDYMAGTADETDQEMETLLGTSSLLKEAKTGRTYLDVDSYGSSAGPTKKNAVGNVSVSPILRESDFLTNEESIKGIFLETETFMPGMTTLAAHNSSKSIRGFTQSIGTYMFFKKRFAARNASAQLLFHPFLVPGFNGIFVDDSDAGQSFIAKIQQVIHNLTHQGCSTQVQLGYARDFDEVDALTGGSGEPPLAPWFDPDKFGKTATDGKLFSQETQYLIDQNLLGVDAFDSKVADREAKAREVIVKNPVTVFNKMSAFFQFLIGTDAVTDVDSTVTKSGLVTTRGAAFYLTQSYKKLANTPEARDVFVNKYIRRDIPNMLTTMAFLGAAPNGFIPSEFAEFFSVEDGPFANRFDGKGFEDEEILKLRRKVILAYMDLLKIRQGFRG